MSAKNIDINETSTTLSDKVLSHERFTPTESHSGNDTTWDVGDEENLDNSYLRHLKHPLGFGVTRHQVEQLLAYLRESDYHSYKEITDRPEIQGDDSMDKILEKYIDKMDRDQSDLRRNISESEKRIENIVEKSEDRNRSSMERIEKSLSDSESRQSDMMKEIQSSLQRMEDRMVQSEQRISDETNTNRHFNIANFLALVAIFIGLGIGLIQVVLAIKSMGL